MKTKAGALKVSLKLIYLSQTNQEIKRRNYHSEIIHHRPYKH